MAQTDIENPYKFINGHFEWNSSTNGLIYISHETAIVEQLQVTKKYVPKLDVTDKYGIEFKDDIDLADKIKFKRKYRRKVDWLEPNVILLQDVKDVALYTANPKNLNYDFIKLLHTPKLDDTLRIGIAYFQLYFQIWEELRSRREELERKIPQPNVKNTACEDLSDLRALLALKYSAFLFENDNKTAQARLTMSECDRRLCEMVTQFSSRVYWYALNKPLLSLIEQEVERLCRSNHFNKFEHMRQLQKKQIQVFTVGERRILRGRTDFEQKRLRAMTPLGKELIYGFHDHRLLAIGQVDFPPSDDRLRFLEKICLLPEEEFAKNNICIGVLGKCRDHFDVMLKPKRRKPTDNEEVFKELVFKMEIPPFVEYSDDTVPWRYPTDPPRIQIKTREDLLMHQCKIWMNRIRIGYQYERDIAVDSCGSLLA